MTVVCHTTRQARLVHPPSGISVSTIQTFILSTSSSGCQRSSQCSGVRHCDASVARHGHSKHGTGVFRRIRLSTDCRWRGIPGSELMDPKNTHEPELEETTYFTYFINVTIVVTRSSESRLAVALPARRSGPVSFSPDRRRTPLMYTWGKCHALSHLCYLVSSNGLGKSSAAVVRISLCFSNQHIAPLHRPNGFS